MTPSCIKEKLYQTMRIAVFKAIERQELTQKGAKIVKMLSHGWNVTARQLRFCLKALIKDVFLHFLSTLKRLRF